MATELQDVRQKSYEAAQAVAPGWERQRASIEEVAAPLRAWLIRELAPQPGQTILELAAGGGDTGFEAARLIGSTGRLIATDFSPAMLDIGRRRAAELGVETVEFHVMDAEHIELADDSVDGVICRFGYMLMVDPAAALAETRRVLRPGGRVVLGVWGAPDLNPYFAVLGRTLVERGHVPPPDPAAPGPFRLGNVDRLRTLLEAAGFADVRIEEVPVRFVFPDIEEYMSVTNDTAGAIAALLRGLPPDERAAVTAQVEAGFAAFATDEGYEVPGVALAAVAD
jgi:SAM-dependent methyltransferase